MKSTFKDWIIGQAKAVIQTEKKLTEKIRKLKALRTMVAAEISEGPFKGIMTDLYWQIDGMIPRRFIPGGREIPSIRIGGRRPRPDKHKNHRR